jgi:carbonic anhydrase/acetyltransferase-like protein (isoleucine patch superfamily)
MAIYQFEELKPVIDEDTFIFDSADIIGNVTIEAGVSIWSNVSIRGDNAAIKIGHGSNIQEGSVLHVDEGFPLTVGPNVTVGHQAMLHGCTITEGALIGMQAIVLNNAKIGRNCLIGAGALVPEGREIPENSLVVGIGKIVRQLSAEEIAEMHKNTRHYVARGREYRTGLKRLLRNE